MGEADTRQLVPRDIADFLLAPTPPEWLEAAVQRIPDLLLDHANCEKKAAATALSMLFRYDRHTAVVYRMSRLAREELRHFEQVQRILGERRIEYRHLGAGRYAESLRRRVRRAEPGRLVDLLVVGAFIEARSCERFALLAPHLDTRLEGFYAGLLAAEARHYRQYLGLASGFTDAAELAARVDHFAPIEAQLATAPDPVFRFHSGPPG